MLEREMQPFRALAREMAARYRAEAQAQKLEAERDYWKRQTHETQEIGLQLVEQLEKVQADAAVLRDVLSEFVLGQDHTRIFLTTRQKMHPAGIQHWDEAVRRGEKALSTTAGRVLLERVKKLERAIELLAQIRDTLDKGVVDQHGTRLDVSQDLVIAINKHLAALDGGDLPQANWTAPLTGREVCKRCGRENPLGFSVPDEVWERAVPEEYRNKTLCIMCFDNLATYAGVNWAATPIQFWPVSGVQTLGGDAENGTL